jgi:hypothetical protein
VGAGLQCGSGTPAARGQKQCSPTHMVYCKHPNQILVHHFTTHNATAVATCGGQPKVALTIKHTSLSAPTDSAGFDHFVDAHLQRAPHMLLQCCSHCCFLPLPCCCPDTSNDCCASHHHSCILYEAAICSHQRRQTTTAVNDKVVDCTRRCLLLYLQALTQPARLLPTASIRYVAT